MRLSDVRWWQLAGAAVLVAIAAVLALDRLFPPPLERVAAGIVVTDRNGEWLHGFTVTGNGQRRWRLAVDLDEVDPVFLERLIAVEDKRFYSHAGVDAQAVARASLSMLRHGEVVSGASTITMQTARLMEPRPRTIGSKLIEMIRALQIEARLSKQEILELYLTLAPYGGNLEGVRAASHAWFGKEPSRLTDAQQALLIALPQAPEARRPDRRPHAAEAGRAKVLARLVEAGLIDPARATEASGAALPQERRAFPRTAWHAADEARRSAAGEGGEIRLTLDGSTQAIAEQLAAGHAARSGDGANVSIIVVENRTRAVRALVGSAWLELAGGWIDMTTARRSPGSTLKPFIYGLAFEDGLAGAATLVDDAPYSFDGYKPENFNREFNGDVTIAEALQHSLNVPAVLTLDRLGPARFAARLDAAGVRAEIPQTADGRASLAIALGGLGMTARELAVLYSGLADGGQMRPLVWREDETGEPADGFSFLSQENAAEITRILRAAPTPAGRMPAALARQAPEIAFKTGTSYGFRDAWAAGYTEDYTVIVWTGHASGQPRPGQTGRDAALPLLFAMFDRIADPVRQPGAMQGPRREGLVAGAALSRLGQPGNTAAPEIVFPENGVEVYLSERDRANGYTLAARGGRGDYAWYVDGRPVTREAVGRRPVWKPDGPGFYRITVVDSDGRSASSAVSVVNAG